MTGQIAELKEQKTNLAGQILEQEQEVVISDIALIEQLNAQKGRFEQEMADLRRQQAQPQTPFVPPFTTGPSRPPLRSIASAPHLTPHFPVSRPQTPSPRTSSLRTTTPDSNDSETSSRKRRRSSIQSEDMTVQIVDDELEEVEAVTLAEGMELVLPFRADRDVVKHLRVRVPQRMEIGRGGAPQKPAGKEAAYDTLAANNSSKETMYCCTVSFLTRRVCTNCGVTRRKPCHWSMGIGYSCDHCVRTKRHCSLPLVTEGEYHQIDFPVVEIIE